MPTSGLKLSKELFLMQLIFLALGISDLCATINARTSNYIGRKNVDSHGEGCVLPLAITSSSSQCIEYHLQQSPFHNSSGDDYIKAFSNFQVAEGESYVIDCSEENKDTLQFQNHRCSYVTCENGYLIWKTVAQRETDISLKDGFLPRIAQIIGEETLVRTGTCFQNATLVDIKFKFNHPTFGNGSYNLYSVCHDENNDATLYTKSYILGHLVAASESIGNRPSFRKNKFYPYINPHKSYNKTIQQQSFAELLRSDSLAQNYFSPDDYFTIGHLVPNGDPICRFEKRATFYFINAFPQWRNVNQMNWNHLERSVRQLAESTNATLTIWTGTYGSLELPDVQDNLVSMWLGTFYGEKLVEPRRLPIPFFAWKVIYDEKRNRGIAIVQINNPWMDPTELSNSICENLCDKISWVTWNIANIEEGYTLCCEAITFKDIVPYAPHFNNDTQLLDK